MPDGQLVTTASVQPCRYWFYSSDAHVDVDVHLHIAPDPPLCPPFPCCASQHINLLEEIPSSIGNLVKLEAL